MKERLQALLTQGKTYPNLSALTVAIRSNSELSEEIRNLYRLIFHRNLSGCSNCIADGFFELAKVDPSTLDSEHVKKK